MNIGRSRIRFCIFVFSLVCCHLAGPLAVGARPMHPPLPGEICPTSSFGSRRTTHIHAGLDFSTGGRIGVPVLAVDTCWVWRVSVASAGYGRALYVVLPDGGVAVYGHLYRFASPIEREVEAEQNREGAYEVEIYKEPGVFGFMPGDTIAFSGDTGAGPPHLHFELRSGKLDHDKINPIPDRLDLRDSVSPRITKVMITPLEADAAIDGGYDAITLVPGAQPPVPRLAGAFGMSVHALDTGLCGRSLSPTGFEARIDDQVIWRLSFDAFPFAKGHFVRAIYQMVGGTPYVRLYDPYGLDLEGFDYYAPRSSRFFKGLAAGNHKLVVKVSDVWGNYDQAELPFYYGTLPDFETCTLSQDASGVGVKVRPAVKACAVSISYRRSGGVWQTVEVRDVGDSQQGRVPGAGAASGLEVSCKLTDPSGLTRQVVLSPGGSASTGDGTRIETKVRFDYVEIWARTPAAPSSLPRAEITEGEGLALCVLQPVEKNVFRGCYFPHEDATVLHLRVVLQFGQTEVERTRDLMLGLIDRGQEVRFSGATLRVRLIAGKERTLKTLVKIEETKPQACAGFSRSEGGIDFEPEDAFFEKGLRVQVSSGSVRLSPKHGLFSQSLGRLAFLAPFDSAGACEATVYTLDPLVVLEDLTAPTVKWTGGLTRKRDGTGVFTGNVSDGGSGIDSRTVTAYVDGDRAVAAYDPDTGKVSVRTTKPLPYGTHRLRLRVQDKLGNTGDSEIVRELVR